MLRKWNATYLRTHPDEGIRNVQGRATGHSEGVFEEYYNLETYSQMRDATLELLQEHQGSSEANRPLSEIINKTIVKDLQEEAQQVADEHKLRNQVRSKIDQTSFTSPTDPYIKLMIR